MDSGYDIRNTRWTPGWKGFPECWVKIKTPGVTGVIGDMVPDPEFEEWIRKVGQEKVDEIMRLASYRGTAMHTFVENFIIPLAKTKDPSLALRTTQTLSPKILEKEEGIPPNKINEGRELFYKFYYSDWSNKYMQLIATELPIYSPTLFYRGKADVFYMDNVFGPTVTDFKTSNGYIKKGSVKEFKYKLQLGGYSSSIEEMYKDKNLLIKRSSILCINTKTDGLQEITVSGAELQSYKIKFKELVKEWHIKNNQAYLVA